MNNQVENSKYWHALYTGIKREKKAVELLTRKHIECYLPLLVKSRRYTRKVRTVHLPLIPSYIFARVSRKEHTMVLSTEYIYDFVRFGGKAAVIPENEINLMKQVVGEDNVIDAVRVNEMRLGQRVELIGGSLTGIHGKIINQSGKRHFLVELEELGYALRLEVEFSKLRMVA